MNRNAASHGGADPLVRTGPLDPLLANEISLNQTKQAGEGVGCGPGSAPQGWSA